ncbi:DNA repair protein RecO [Pedobacter sp. HMF7647]|uniref:DNA repair protein RecO n=1 Tax=Hufsiella arboris TaxID=2695275 RepID=A0A7K1YAG1_9SPHI|nr:DNA repair protein RecO [Hufsiella arboris]MXV51099.1 DNA repair protein RecO [Hufsiella arboris]
MLHKTRGIVFKTTDYSESSVVVQIFTEKFGLQSYLINGVKKSKSKIRYNMLQPLHLLDMVVYNKPTGNIQRVAELKNDPVFQTIPYDIIKSSLAMFLNEMLYKSVKQQSADEQLFEYLYTSIHLLDRTESGLQNFHLYFLLRLTRHLGFFPDLTLAGKANYFDLKDGAFTAHPSSHSFVLQQPHTGYWAALLSHSFDKLHTIKIANADRRVLLSKLIDYYRLHVENMGEIKSLQVLEEILS